MEITLQELHVLMDTLRRSLEIADREAVYSRELRLGLYNSIVARMATVKLAVKPA